MMNSSTYVLILPCILWALLCRYYSIFSNYNIPHFTVNTVPDRLLMNTMIFTLLFLIYTVNYCLSKRYKEIPFSVKISIILAFTVTSILNILTHPIGGSDVFNYIINCKVSYYHHLNPYTHSFEPFGGEHLAKYLKVINKPLGFGPAWIILSYVPSMFMDFTSIVSMILWYKVYNCLFLAGTAILIYHYQDSDRKWISLYLFLMNPLILFEGLVNGHNDIMMTFFLIFAIFKLRQNSIYSLPLLTLSALIKFFTLPLFPLFIIESYRKHRQMNKIVLSCLLSFLVIIILFLPYWDKGNMIKGMLSGMSSYHNTGGLSIPSIMKGYMKVNKLGGISYVTPVFGIIFLIFLFIETFFIKGTTEERMTVLLTFFLITVSLFYPWHFIPVLTVLTFCESKRHVTYLFTATFSSMAFYPLSVWLLNFSGLSVFYAYLCLSLLMLLPVIIFFIGTVILNCYLKIPYFSGKQISKV